MIKWRLFIYEPENNLDLIWNYSNWTFDGLSIQYPPSIPSDEIGNILNDYIDDVKNYDHTILVYDANRWLDGIANDAICTMAFKENRNECNHHTHGLIDYWLTTPNTEENRKKVYAEILYVFYSRFFTNNKMPGKTEDEKIALIEELKNNF